MIEDQRYKAVQEQIKQFLDLSVERQTYIAGFGYAWLAAEMFAKNEEAHNAHVKARKELLAVLQERIASEQL
jgi:hypothetical protein